MNRILLKLLFVLLLLSNSFQITAQDLPYLVAHRGAWFDYDIPENTVAAVEMAKRYGYQSIECDVQYTSDGVMVIMHDKTINRTMRNAIDYSEISTPIEVSKITYKELREKYVIQSSKESLRLPIPTLEELLLACKKQKIVPMLHSAVFESYEMAQKIMGDNWICFNSDTQLAQAARKISDCLILVDLGRDTTGTIERLQSIGGRCGVSTMRKELLTASFCKKLRAHGYEIQSSIFKSPFESQAVSNGISILLTDFSLTGTKLKARKKWSTNDFGKSKGRFLLASGEELIKEGSEAEYGGLLLRIKLKGSLEVEINNERIYPIIRDKENVVFVSVRYQKSKPKVRIVAKEDTDIIELETEIYEL
ncbi:hypothetical protein GQF61_07475 [Sphingobacterium sp. DK4209]|uniref:GP-PDE domain-containing protein n=1 Tax=Sphingobacterium zhuxiongii TaxID=2662364 RepID=A0A5Q0QIV0_9SPHI|nr:MULTISPECIES: glycerophosphodiester phosphodiesterase family protein [unclassified Sphingobacterium]MVZ65694.1 hypothetical protein [Sphingobacterium sp. DK4209]QGA27892.1 hypothetical protein GFH32_16865 [Sphingobacterium sp. dk4302]